jgi:hypothetical protein
MRICGVLALPVASGDVCAFFLPVLSYHTPAILSFLILSLAAPRGLAALHRHESAPAATARTIIIGNGEDTINITLNVPPGTTCKSGSNRTTFKHVRQASRLCVESDPTATGQPQMVPHQLTPLSYMHPSFSSEVYEYFAVWLTDFCTTFAEIGAAPTFFSFCSKVDSGATVHEYCHLERIQTVSTSFFCCAFRRMQRLACSIGTARTPGSQCAPR